MKQAKYPYFILVGYLKGEGQPCYGSLLPIITTSRYFGFDLGIIVLIQVGGFFIITSFV